MGVDGGGGRARWEQVDRLFEMGGRDEATFLRLLDRLPDAEHYETDAYRVYGALPVNKHVVGKYGAVNWNEGLHSMLRGKLNRLVRRTKGYTKSVEMLVSLLALVSATNSNSIPLTTKNTRIPTPLTLRAYNGKLTQTVPPACLGTAFDY